MEREAINVNVFRDFNNLPAKSICYVLCPNVKTIPILSCVFRSIRKLLTHGSIIGLIVIASTILFSSHAQSHNNKLRYRHVSHKSNFNFGDGDYDNYHVTIRNNHSPGSKNIKDISRLKHDTFSKPIYLKRLSNARQTENLPKGLEVLTTNIRNGDSLGVYDRHHIVKVAFRFNQMNIIKRNSSIRNKLLLDSYRSRTLCIGYYQTQWIRDARNCSRFFVCSRNRVDAVLTCPKTFVWSNRVTNCVPPNSRWDDCMTKTTETIRNVNMHHSGFYSDNEREQSKISEQIEPNFEQASVSLTSGGSHRTPPQTTAQPVQHQSQFRKQNHFSFRRQRLGYRSTNRFKDRFLKRKIFTRRGYVIQLIKKNAASLQHENNDKNVYNETYTDYDVNFSRRRQRSKQNNHRYKYAHRTIKQKKPYTTLAPTTLTSYTTDTSKPTKKLRKRKRRKYRVISSARVRSKFPSQNLISSPRYFNDLTTRINEISSGNIFDESEVKLYITTTESTVTKWWMSLSTGATTKILETTTNISQTSTPISKVFVPECGVSAAPLIVGGLPVKRDKWPWVVSLQLTWLNRHMCGATLIHPRWLVTAAHCMAEPDLSHAADWMVIFGNVKFQAKVDHIVKHPSFVNGDNYPNDIAMLRLQHPADVTGFHIRHACLPPMEWNRSHWDRCWIMGWGEAKEGTVTELKELEVNIWKNSECSARWGWKRILNSHMCVGTGDSGACNGDSGGPLICRRKGYHYLTGVTSWGVYGCQTTGYPGVFVNVASYRKWIDDVIRTQTN